MTVPMPAHCKENAKWKRRSDGRSFPVRYLCKPRSVADIVDAVLFAEDQDLRVRAVGYGHSYSSVATTTGVCLDMKHMNKVISIDRLHIDGSVDQYAIAHCQAGISIESLNRKLRKKDKKFPLALENMGSYDRQLLAGAIATGTHGSSGVDDDDRISFGPLASQVVSLDIVIAGGEERHFDRGGSPEWSAEWFDAVVVSMGCTGVIYEMALKVVPTYDLLEHRTVSTWKSVRKNLEQGDVLKKYRHVEAWVNPYVDVGGKNDRHTCLLMTRHVPSKEEKSQDFDDHRPRKHYLNRGPFSHYLAWLGGFIGHLAGKRFEDPIKTASSIQKTLKCLGHEGFLERNDKVLLLGAENEAVKASLGIEFSFPRSRYLEAVEMLFGLAKRRTRQERTFLSSFVAIRFVREANAYLAMQQGVDTVTLEMGVLKSVAGAEDILNDCSRRLLAVGGRPHWGLDRGELSGADVRRLYSKTFDKWYEVYRKCNRDGRFNNEFTDRLGISIDPSDRD